MDRGATGGVVKVVRLLAGSLMLLLGVVSGLAVDEEASASRGPSIRFMDATGEFELGPFPEVFSSGLAADFNFEKVFRVRVAEGDPARSAMAGTYLWTAENFLKFVPSFAVVPGMSYEVAFRLDALPQSVIDSAWTAATTTIEVSKSKDSLPAEVTAVYPSADRLPENLLKFYLHFSQPMSRGEAYQNIRLLDDQGESIELPFLELGEELWDAEQRRFTLFFDPGRVKRGLKPHMEEGRPLRAGKSYTLVVQSDWKDARGEPLTQSFRKVFAVIDADYTQPDLAAWTLTPPPVGTSEPLQVEFEEALDHALLERVLWVQDSTGKRVSGVASVGKGETKWSWIPDQSWTAGEYQLVVESILEDLSGNSLDRPFEVVGEPGNQVSELRFPKQLRRPFRLR